MVAIQDFHRIAVEDGDDGAGEVGGVRRTLPLHLIIGQGMSASSLTASSWGPDTPSSGHRASRQT